MDSLTNIENNANSLLNKGKEITSAIQDKPNLEDQVSEALLKITASDKFIESMSSSISSIIKSEILKPALTTQLNKVNDIISQVEKLECNNKEVKKEEAEAVANTIKEAIDAIDDKEAIDVNDINVANAEEEGSATNAEVPATDTEGSATNAEGSVGGKVRKSRRKNTKKTRKSRRNKRRN